MELETCIISLKIISNIQIGQRIVSTESYINIETPSLIPEFIRRWKRADGRTKAIKLLNVIINNSIHFYKKGELNQRYLNEAITGLHNLQSTYSDDPLTMCCIDTLVDKIMNNLPPTDF
jgi:hypothetical protein